MAEVIRAGSIQSCKGVVSSAFKRKCQVGTRGINQSIKQASKPTKKKHFISFHFKSHVCGKAMESVVCFFSLLPLFIFSFFSEACRAEALGLKERERQREEEDAIAIWK